VVVVGYRGAEYEPNREEAGERGREADSRRNGTLMFVVSEAILTTEVVFKCLPLLSMSMIYAAVIVCNGYLVPKRAHPSRPHFPYEVPRYAILGQAVMYVCI